MPTIYDGDEPAGKQHPASEFFHDYALLTQRSLALVCDVINDPVRNRLAEFQEINKVVDGVRRLFRQWQRDQISLDEMVTAVRRERMRLIPNASASASASS